MPVCAVSDCNDETPLEGTLCADHLEQATAYHLIKRRKRLISTGEIQEKDPDIDVISIRLNNN